MRKVPRPTYSSVVSTLALFLALGGATYAATSLPANSVGRAQIRNGSITLSKLAKSTRVALKRARGPRGLPGATGATGPQGASGASAANDTELRETIARQDKEIEQLNANVTHLTGELHGVEGTVGTVQGTAQAAGEAAASATQKAHEAEVDVMSLQSAIGAVEGTAKTAEEAAASATQKAEEASAGVTGVNTKLGTQCAGINELVTHTNQLTAGVSELTAALNLVLGGFLPHLPENSKSLSC